MLDPSDTTISPVALGGIGIVGTLGVWARSLVAALAEGFLQPLTISAAPSWVEDVRVQSGIWARPGVPRGSRYGTGSHQVQAQMGPGPQGWVGDTPGCGCRRGGLCTHTGALLWTQWADICLVCRTSLKF